MSRSIAVQPASRGTARSAHGTLTAELRAETVVCPYCAADPADGQARTIAVGAGCRLTVTWHVQSCPHYAADRVLAGKED